MSAFNVFAAPNAAPSNAECKEYTTSIPGQGFTTVTDCCWTETDPNDPEGIELYYCQECTQNGCAEKRPASQGPTRPPSGPVAPLQGGVLEQLEQNEQPPLFGWNIPQGGFEVLQERETPPMFGQIAPEGQILPPTGDKGLTGVAPRTAEPLIRTCPVGNVWDPKAMICVPDVPPLDLELCPDGSIPQSTGPGGIRPECPPSEAQQLRSDQPEEQDAGQPEEPQAEEEQQSSAE